ncbi:MAG: hypothetical protein LBT92_04135 [Rickettsiales bacterium]|jgi:hypothetical protein|nr:hypothetical protein [Rickettsiales bacterium]
MTKDGKISRDAISLITDNGTYAGYTTAVNSMAAAYDREAEAVAITDIDADGSKLRTREGLLAAPANRAAIEAITFAIKDNDEDRCIDILAAGPHGLRFVIDASMHNPSIYKAASAGKLRLVYTTEQFYDAKLPCFPGKAVMLVNDYTKKQYLYANPSITDSVEFVAMDSMPAEPKSAMDARADKFMEQNRGGDGMLDAAKLMSEFGASTVAFMGGQMKDAAGKPIRLTPEACIDFANRLVVESGEGNIIVGTHGIRTFADGIIPFDCFLGEMAMKLPADRKAALFGRESHMVNGEPKLVERLFVLGGKNMYSLGFSGVPYNALLRHAVEKGMDAVYTADQALGAKEFERQGGDPARFRYDFWPVNSAATELASRAVMGKIAAGEKVLDSAEALAEYEMRRKYETARIRAPNGRERAL